MAAPIATTQASTQWTKPAQTRVASVAQAVPATKNVDTLTLGGKQPSALGATIAPLANSPLRGGNQIDLFVNGSEAYPQIHQLIDGAEKRIDMEFFSFHNDPSGQKIADKLIEKAKSGVQVNLLIDGKANIKEYPLLNKMQDAGVRVQRFTNGFVHPWLNPTKTTDHRKILLVDGKAGTIGGMNIGERYEKYWHDFLVKFQGPTVQDVYGQFEKNWTMSNGKPLLPVELDLAPKGDKLAQVAVTAKDSKAIKAGMLSAMDNAEHHIMINSPYFIDPEVVSHLKDAAGRGIHVTAQIPNVGDNGMVNVMNDSVANELLKAGVHVNRYDTLNPEFGKHDHVTDNFDHGKVMTVDGRWTSIGTANADTLSMDVNQEINLQIDSPEFAKNVESRIFQHDVTSGKSLAAEEIPFTKLKGALRDALNGLRPHF